MKTSKKISLLMISCLAFIGVGLLNSPKAAAVVTSQQQIVDGLSTLHFKNRATIEGTFGSDTITFTDRNPYDTGGGEYNYVPEDGFFCSTGSRIIGITIKNGAIAPSMFGSVASSVPASIDLDYNSLGTTGDNGCKGEPPLNGGVITNGVAFSSFEWDNGDLKEYSSGDRYQQLSSKASNFYVTDKSDVCYGSNVVALNNDNQGVIYRLVKGAGVGGYKDASKDSVLSNYITQANKCTIASTFPTSIIGDRSKSAAAAATVTGNVKPDPSCESNFSTGFEWLICPALGAADDLANKFNNFIEGQLNFCTGVSSTTGLKNCSDNNLTDQVKKAWAIFRVLASVALVIVLLFMVLSEALNFGFFDAYTIRKTLPKIVIAVILIQISWVMFKFFIDLSNDLGTGIRDIMYAPFGGSDNIQIEKMIGNGIGTASGDHGNTFALFTFVATLTAVWVSLPGIFTLAFFVVFSLLTAFVTLIFRKLLIITLIILSPVALICWIMPGLDRYWKMWLTNYQKILLMFPLIMGLLAGGRIFAYITGSSSGKGVTSFADLAIILVAYFGPLFLLPKTYAWGGEFMKMGANAAKTGMDKIKAKPMEYAKNRGDSWRESRREASKERVAKGQYLTRNPLSAFTATSDKFRSGQWDPLYGRKDLTLFGKQVMQNSKRREKAELAYKAGGAQAEEEEIKNAKLSNELEYGSLIETDREDYVREKARGRLAKIKNGRMVRDEDGNIQYENSKPSIAQRRAAFDKLTALGGEGNFAIIEEWHNKIMEEAEKPNASKEEKEAAIMMGKYKDANAQVLFAKLPHLYKNFEYDLDNVNGEANGNKHNVSRTIRGLNAENIAGLSATGMDTLLTESQQRIKFLRDNEAARIAEAQTKLNDARAAGASAPEIDKLEKTLEEQRSAVSEAEGDVKYLVQVYNEAAHDENIKGRIGSAVSTRMKEFVNQRANLTPTGNQPYQVDPQALGINSDVATIKLKVTDEGVIKTNTGPVVLNPGEIKIEHTTNIETKLPPPATLAAGSPDRETFKIQLQSDPVIANTLAKGIAYGVAAPEHIEVLEEMRNNALATVLNPAATPEQITAARDSWNKVAEQIQRSYQEKLEEEVASSVHSGVDPSLARTAAATIQDPVTGKTYAEEILDLMPAGGSSLRKL